MGALKRMQGSENCRVRGGKPACGVLNDHGVLPVQYVHRSGTHTAASTAANY